MNKGNIYLLDNQIKQEPTSSPQLNNTKLILTQSDIKQEQVEPIQTQINDQTDPINIYISNVVCSYSTRCHLNLRRIAMEGMHVEYKKENGMVNMKLRKPYTTATIWSSGKVTCAGAKSEQDAYIAARRYCRLLQKMQFKVRMSNYRVVNVLSTCAVPFALDISKLAEKYQKECSYEPELHPGATFKIKELKATLKLFTTGSITLTSPSVLTAQQAVTRIYPILVEFKRILNSSTLQTPNATQQLVSSIKLQHQQQQIKTETITNTTNNWLYQPKIESSNSNLAKFTHHHHQPQQLYTPIIPTSFHLNHHHLHTTYSEPLLYSGTSLSPSNSFNSSLSLQPQQQIVTQPFLSVNTNGTSSGSIFSPNTNSSNSLYSTTGSSQSQAPSHWFYDNLLIDNNVDDFLP